MRDGSGSRRGFVRGPFLLPARQGRVVDSKVFAGESTATLSGLKPPTMVLECGTAEAEPLQSSI